MWMTALKILLSALSSLLMQLMTERFIKQLLIIGLEALVKKTENKEDDKLVEAVKQAWEKQDAK